MNKQLMVVIGIVAVVAIAGAAFTLSNRVSSSKVGAGTPNTVATSETPTTLTQIMGMNKNQECTFSNNTGTSGTVYISGKQVRGDYAMEGGLTASTITDGTWMYSWSSAANQGIKTKIETTASVKSSPTTTTDESKKYLNPDSEMNFSCKAWTVDNSKFAPPNNIQFMEFSADAMMPKQSPTSNALPKDNEQCAACDALSGQAKTMCQQSLCN